jgi:diguanylate cyclase (GGDEF)-like protein/PAS domain S-box-containing protein
MMEKPFNVLLVDDDEDEYVLLKSMFPRLPGKSSGRQYRLDWAATYPQALEDCAQNPYDILLVDYHLGQNNGLELIRAAKHQGVDAPFILLTGQGSYELDLEAMQLGVYDYLVKDQLNEFTLERTLRYALDRKQAEAELDTRVQERTVAMAEINRALQSEIDRRIQAETTLRESEARFRALAETTSAAIFIVQDGKIRYANPAARYVTGFTPEELVGMELWRLAHPAYQAALRESRMMSRWSDQVPARYEVKIIHKNGAERWVDMTAGDMLYEGRSAWVFTAFDITERDLAERALRRARDELEQRVDQRTAEIQATSRRLQAVLQNLPVGIVIVDEHGQILECNDLFCDLWGITGTLQRAWDEWAPLRGRWAESGEKFSLRGWLYEHTVQRGEAVMSQMVDIETLNHEQRSILFSAVPIESSGEQRAGGVAVIQDVTQQRVLEQQAQEAAKEARQRADELEGLHRATAALLSTLDLDELLLQILDAAQSAIPAAEKGLLHLISPSTGELQVRATLGFSDTRIRVIHSSRDPGYPAVVVRERKPLLISDTHAAGVSESLDSLSEEMGGARSIILTPLSSGDQVFGALSLSASTPGAFTESNLRLLASFGATTTAALQNAILHAEIKQLAVTDPLTGDFNRRAFFELGRRELERFLRFNHPLSAVMMDLDHFKTVNDTYGHAAGDQILRILSERCRNIIRETDIFCRYGGDEFILLLPDTDLLTARFIASRIHDAVTGAPWQTEQGLIPVSISLGVVHAEKRHRRLEDLLEEADKALYQAKERGRNRVEVVAE